MLAQNVLDRGASTAERVLLAFLETDEAVFLVDTKTGFKELRDGFGVADVLLLTHEPQRLHLKSRKLGQCATAHGPCERPVPEHCIF